MTDADRATEVCEIGATAHTDMLTCIDDLPGGSILERTGAASQSGASFKESYGEPVWRQGCRRCQACQASSQNQDPVIRLHVQPHRAGIACTTKLNLRQRLKETLLVKTS